MSEAHQTPAGETRVELETPITDDRSAGRALEGLLFADDDADAGDPAQNSGDEPDAGPGESEATGSEDGATEPPARPGAIDAPNSWSAEDKALFAKLPPATQAVLARRESERDKLVQSRTQEIANERKGWDAEREAIQTQRGEYLKSLQHLTALALPEAEQFKQIDWQKLASENPAEYVRLSGAREALVGRLGALQQEINRVSEQTRADQAKHAEAVVAQERSKLIERVPEFGDTEKGPKLIGEMRGFLKDAYGFNDHEVNSVVDHRLVALAHDLMRLKQADAARATAQGKRANTAPQVQRPGTTQPSDATADSRIKGLVGQLGKTNSTRDAGRLLESIL